jgi:hypothetical protein
MGSFETSFFWGAAITFLVLVLLWLIVPPVARLLFPASISDRAARESTEWLNFVLHRLSVHFSTASSLKKVNDSLGPDVRLVSLGNAPTISHVDTLEMVRCDEVRLLIPIDWRDGPSRDVSVRPGFVIEIDIRQIVARVLVAWPGAELRISVDSGAVIDCDIAARIGRAVRFSIGTFPLVGTVVKAIVTAAIVRRPIIIPIPQPDVDAG